MSALLKSINHNPFGDKLRETRLDKGLTIKRVSSDLNIPAKYLEALENYELNLLPINSVNRLIENYSDYLGIKFKDLSELRKDTESLRLVINFKKQKNFSIYDILAKSFLWILAAAFFIFLAVNVTTIFSPPKLLISSPQDGLITYQRQLKISGQTAVEAEVVINNMAVLVDPKGNFDTVIDLQKGLNLIKITSKKRYSRLQENVIRVLFKD